MKRIFIILVMLAALMVAFIPSGEAKAYLVGQWKSVTVDNTTLLSAEVDLGDSYGYLDVYVPTMSSDNVTIYVARDTGGTYSRLGVSGVHIATSTGDLYYTVTLGNFQYIKLKLTGTQTSTLTFYYRAWRP